MKNKNRGINSKPQACQDYLNATKGPQAGTDDQSTTKTTPAPQTQKPADNSNTSKKSPCQNHFANDATALATCVANMEECQTAKQNGQTSKQNRHPSCSALKTQIREAMAASTQAVTGRALAIDLETIDFDLYEYFGF